LCEQVLEKSKMTSHLRTCSQRSLTAQQKDNRAQSSRYTHLLVEGRDLPHYWLHLAVPGQAKLESLDAFLRHIWLECCGHMSAFTAPASGAEAGPTRADLLTGEDTWPGELSFATLVRQAAPIGVKFDYEYDFGSTTCLSLKIQGELELSGKSRRIEVLARNRPPPIVCEECGQPATQVCSVCLYSDKAWYCDKCMGRHGCGEEGWLPVVNSPRVGVCAYCG
jgi:hypothetical protein